MENATGMGNLELYQQFRAVPENAQRAITGGRLKGMKKRTLKQDVSFQNALQKILANAR